MFDWNTVNEDHVARHDVTPVEAEQVISNNPLSVGPYIRHGEERFDNIGETDAGRVLVVIATWRTGRIRVVTAFPANQSVRRWYAQQKDLDNEKDLTGP